jgi:hypothetical protein
VLLLFERAFASEKISMKRSEFSFAFFVSFLRVCLIGLETFSMAGRSREFRAVLFDS